MESMEKTLSRPFRISLTWQIKWAVLLSAVLALFFSADLHAQQRPMFLPAPDSPISVGDGPGSIALADVNQDGKADLVVASARGLTVLLGQGDGRFHIPPGSPIHVPKWPSEMLLRDFNGDGKLDVAFANHDSFDVILLFGDGKGGFTLAPHSPVAMKQGQHPPTHGL